MILVNNDFSAERDFWETSLNWMISWFITTENK